MPTKTHALLPTHPFACLLTANGTRPASDGPPALLRAFLVETCEKAPGGAVPLSLLSDLWRAWLLERGAPPIWYVPRDQGWLAQELRSLGFPLERGHLLNACLRRGTVVP